MEALPPEEVAVETAVVAEEVLEVEAVLAIEAEVVLEVPEAGEGEAGVEVLVVVERPSLLNPIAIWEFSSQEEKKMLW